MYEVDIKELEEEISYLKDREKAFYIILLETHKDKNKLNKRIYELTDEIINKK